MGRPTHIWLGGGGCNPPFSEEKAPYTGASAYDDIYTYVSVAGRAEAHGGYTPLVD